MIDIRLIRKDRFAVEKQLKTKDPQIDLTNICHLDHSIREAKTKVETFKAKRNEISQKIGEMKRANQDTFSLMNEVAGFGTEIHFLDNQIKEWEEQFNYELSSLPNLPMEDIKISQDPKENVVIKEFGQKPIFSFPFKNHVELNEKLNLFDFKRGAKISGTGWPVYRAMGARLEWALIQYMIEIHVKNGFTQWIPPLLVRKNTVFGSGQLPKFESQQFKIQDEDYHLYLIPTAEVPLNGLHMDEIIPQEELSLKYVAYTPCFRREAGAAGSQERGLIRMHQFNKVEMFCFTKPEESAQVFNQMMDSAEEILQGLELHYRNALLVTGDMSFAAARTIDIEVWLPGQNRYYEVSSVSNCTDYQSRRSNTRFRREDGKLDFVHTLNGSGLATSRLMVALLENNQREDGSVCIPNVLQRYLNGQSTLNPTI
ncbi:Serine--tRNA ligase [Candidatus Protochlamydia amoebophila]|uniref:serine--tRNA ligase n=1 Tax=Candidatus Protochlamydia amoebophila TaxID=362787 RepID=UPI001BC91280|nr:serine--tRNA ligase [Candidatus Protochlamydia amoebophila]MBS4164209.1 Serine--tRNA ligase [Candidatus Protochlamydia amoebophila]